MRFIPITRPGPFWPMFLTAACLGQVALAAEAQVAVWPAATGISWSWLSLGLVPIALLGAVALAWAARRFFLRRGQAVRNDPRQLLRELCQGHGLSRRAERLLRRAALELGTPHAGRMFLEPQLLLEAQRLPRG